MTRRLTSRLFVRMLREEWRLHAAVFGGRFAAFPLVVAAMAGGGIWLLTVTGTGTDTIAAGLHGLVFFFGLQVGTVGLFGRDALEDVIDDVTLLVFSARTLPITWRRLLVTMLVKDVCYYSALFIAPVAAGYAAVALSSGTSPAAVGLLWVTATGAFGLGVGTSLTLAGLGTRSRPLLLALVAAVTGAFVVTGIDPLALTPYGTFRAPRLASAVAGFAPVVVLGVTGPLLFQPPEQGAARTAGDLYPRLRGVVGDPVAARTLIEEVRSTGSVWKVLFSMGVLFGVTGLLVREVSAATALSPSPGIAFGTLLGLGAFTTYSWMTQFDAAPEYLRYPRPLGAVFAGKRTAYLALSVPAGLVYLAVAALWIPLSEVALGAVVFVLVAVYVFGVTAYLTGLSPNVLLFDTPRFVLFGACLSVVAVPLVTAALAAPVAPTRARAVAVGVGLVAAIVGWALAGRAGPRWHERTRAGE